MSDIDRSMLAGAEPRLFLLPQELEVDERFNVRKYSMKSEAAQAKEQKLLDEMAESLSKQQLDDVLAIEDSSGGKKRYIVFAGHRRRAAALIENQRRSANGQPLLRLRVRLIDNTSDVRQQAIQSNLVRQNLSGMDLAMLIQEVMDENGWTGFNGQKKAAKYLGVSTALVVTHSKFVNAPHELQEKLGLGLISVDSALQIIGGLGESLGAESVQSVLTDARAKQVEAAKQKASADVAAGKKTTEQAQEVVAKAAEGKIEAPAVAKAVREHQDKQVEDGKAKPVRRTLKEVLEWVQSLDGPAYGHPDSAVREWARKFYAYCMGEASEKVMQGRFDTMTENAHQGTKEASEKERLKEQREAEKAQREAEKKEKEKQRAKEQAAKEREAKRAEAQAKRDAEKAEAKAKKDAEKAEAQAKKDADKAKRDAEKAEKEAARKAAADEKLRKKLAELEEARKKLLEGKASESASASATKSAKPNKKSGKK